MFKNKKNYKFLLIGSNGLLGNQLKKILPKSQTFCIARKKSDLNINLENFVILKNIFEIYKFKFVINCAGYTNLNYCEKNFKKCKIINSDLPKILIKLSQIHNFKLIHISTDQLFLNKTNTLIKENNKFVVTNNYSKSKILAEKNILKYNKKNYLIVRTNFTGFKKKLISTFPGWLLDSMNKNKKINLFSDMLVSTLDVKTCAKNIRRLIKQNAYGVYNLSTNKPISKKDFAIYFSKKISRKINYREISVQSIKSFTKRAKYLGLNVKKIEKKLNTKMITPYKAIDNLIKQIPEKYLNIK